MNRYMVCIAIALASISTVRAQVQPAAAHPFQLSSTTFANHATLPISMINNNPVNGVNTCSVDGSPGGNQSPELSWTNAPKRTASFIVVAFDVTASFTHWGMYNIPATTTELPRTPGSPEVLSGLKSSMTFLPRRNTTAPARPTLNPSSTITCLRYTL
jgi:phosphatidylethanolamine-binding protein (PEBP) family uncharacterized protein